MIYVCPSCKEEFQSNKKHLLICPFCDELIIEEKMYNEIKTKVENSNYSEEEFRKILEEEEGIYKKIQGSLLGKYKDYLEAMFKLLKDPKSEIVNKISALASLIYVVNPLDLIPDLMPAVGYLDDAGAVMIAVAMMGKALENYYSNTVKSKTRKNNDTVLYKFTYDPYYCANSANVKNNVVTWQIPTTKKNNIKNRLITNKLINANETYVLTKGAVDFLVPIKDFDQYIIDNIFNEATTIFKALGVKSIKYKKKLATTSDKKIAGKSQFQNIFNTDVNVSKRGISIQTDESSSFFEKVNLIECIGNNEFVNSLVWYFTDSSILDENVFVERFEKGLLNTTITRTVELSSVLDIDSRVNIKKYGDISSEVSVSEGAKVQWTIDVEYYSLSEVDKIDLKNTYENLKISLKERKKELINC